MSFALALVITGMLRGSDDESPTNSPPGGVELDRPQSLPLVEPWDITVAVTGLGRAESITVLRRPAASDEGSVMKLPLPPTRQLQPGEDAASGQLRAGWDAAGRDRPRRSQAVLTFLDRAGHELADTVAIPPAVARAAESARFAAAVQGGCLSKRGIKAKAVSAAMTQAGEGWGLGRHPPNARYVGKRGELNVRQVGIVGSGKRRLAVAIVAEVPQGDSPPRAAERKMLTKVAKWIDDHVHLKQGFVARCSGRR